MTNFEFTLTYQEELVNHSVSGTRLYRIEYFVLNDFHGALSHGEINAKVNENGVFLDSEQLENINTEIRSAFQIKIKEYLRGLPKE